MEIVHLHMILGTLVASASAWGVTRVRRSSRGLVSVIKCASLVFLAGAAVMVVVAITQDTRGVGRLGWIAVFLSGCLISVPAVIAALTLSRLARWYRRPVLVIAAALGAMLPALFLGLG